MELRFLSLASGSSGNCYYLGTPDFGILIDAGIGIRTIRKVLKEYMIDFGNIAGVIITHDHADLSKRSAAWARNITCPSIRPRRFIGA